MKSLNKSNPCSKERRCDNYQCKKGGCNNVGSSNRLIYDCCAYKKSLNESTSPLIYNLYEGKFQNCNKCTYENKFWRPFSAEIVDVESDLLNITRPSTRCENKKYNPSCGRSRNCLSTYEPDAPVILDRDICPVVYNNIPTSVGKGYKLKKFSC